MNNLLKNYQTINEKMAIYNTHLYTEQKSVENEFD